MSTRNRVAAIRLGVVLAAIGVGGWMQAGTTTSSTASKRMPDGKEWMTTNLNVVVPDSYCYDNAATNCTKYGRLYTWASAHQACRSLANGWRLPTNDEWRLLVKQYGGVRDDSDDGGKAAFPALVAGGRSGFNVLFGGGREPNGEYARLEAHGLYWTATESSASRAWAYNFGGARFVNRHENMEQSRAISVRCIRD